MIADTLVETTKEFAQKIRSMPEKASFDEILESLSSGGQAEARELADLAGCLQHLLLGGEGLGWEIASSVSSGP